MSGIRVIFSTVDSLQKAEEIAFQLVTENLAACVSIIPELTSVYKWKGEVERATEQLLMIKTAEESVPRLMERLRELHPYELPEMLVLAVDTGYPPYMDWVRSGSQ